MNWFPFAATAVSLIGFYLAHKTLLLDSEALLNRVFAGAVVITAVFTFLTGLLTAVQTPEAVQMLLRIIGILHIFYLLSTMLVAFVYSRIKFFWLVLYLLIHLPYDIAVAAAVWQDQWLFTGFHPTVWGNVIEIDPNSPWILADYGRGLFDFIVGTALMIYAWRSSRNARKKQVILLIVITTVTVTLITFYLKFNVWLGQGYPDYSPLSILLGYLVYLVMIHRYGHLSETRPKLQQRLLFATSGILIFTDRNGKIIEAPPAAELAFDQNPLPGKNLPEILSSWPGVKDNLSRLNEQIDQLPAETGMIGKKQYSLTLIPQHHARGDLEGILFQFKPVKSLDAICAQYSLTPREQEVVTLLSEGCRNKEIAQKLFISDATAKNHMHKILQKTGTTSRTELIRVLLEEAETD